MADDTPNPFGVKLKKRAPRPVSEMSVAEKEIAAAKAAAAAVGGGDDDDKPREKPPWMKEREVDPKDTLPSSW